MWGKKLKEKLEHNFGSIPDFIYFDGDMENIRKYYQYRRDNEKNEYMIDDTTWNDLDMESVYKRLNSTLTISGEQYLYFMLRHPIINESDYEENKSLISEMTNNSKLRLNLQVILSKLGKTRNIDLCSAFKPGDDKHGWLTLYICLAIIIPVSLIISFFMPAAIAAAIIAVIANSILHEIRLRKTQKNFDTLNYSISMIFTLTRIKKVNNPILKSLLAKTDFSLKELSPVFRMGNIVKASGNEIVEIACSVFLIDLMTYEILKLKIGRCHNEFFNIHEHLGKLDAAISIASYRKSVAYYVEPNIEFEGFKNCYIKTNDMAHPLVNNSVPNDLITSQSLLITGYLHMHCKQLFSKLFSHLFIFIC